jgi:hypothetical protein
MVKSQSTTLQTLRKPQIERECNSNTHDIYFMQQDVANGDWLHLKNAIVEEFDNKRGVFYFNRDDNDVISNFLQVYPKPIRNIRIAVDKVALHSTVEYRILDLAVSVYTVSHDVPAKKDRCMCQFKVLNVTEDTALLDNHERTAPKRITSRVWDYYRSLVKHIDTNKP